MSETVRQEGTALIERLQTVAGEVSTLLLRISNVRPGPPVTSRERRRVAEQADESTAALLAACADIDRWHCSLTDDPGVADVGLDQGISGRDADESTSALVAVSRADEALARASADLHLAVEAARSQGASWRAVGRALDITGQTAHKRFDPQARQKHADYMRERYQRLNSR